MRIRKNRAELQSLLPPGQRPVPLPDRKRKVHQCMLPCSKAHFLYGNAWPSSGEHNERVHNRKQILEGHMEYDRFSGTGRDKWPTNYLYVVANPANLKQDVSRGFNIENPTKIRKSTIEFLTGYLWKRQKMLFIDLVSLYRVALDRFHSVTVSHGTLNPVTQVRLLVEPRFFIFSIFRHHQLVWDPIRLLNLSKMSEGVRHHC